MDMDIDVYTYLVRPDAATIWRNKEVVNRLSWYYKVMKKLRPPKYIIAKYIPVEEPDGSNLEIMFREHDRARDAFLKLYRDIESGGESIDGMERPKYSFLDLKIDIAREILKKCGLCEWNCNVNRWEGRKGVCGLDSYSYVGSAFLHFGEEAPLVPSGTIFFTGCSLKCVFCQNWDISQNPNAGVKVTPKELADIALELDERGAKNINYVGGNPDQDIHNVIESLRYMDVWIPLLWNSNMYMTLNALDILIDLIDIWLPDFKWWDEDHAFRYSRIKRYREVVTRNLKIVYDYGSDIIIRHLLMPNHIECCTYPILEWIAENTPDVLVNIMDQYRPEYKASYDERFKDIGRRINRDEVLKAYSYASKLNIVYEPIS
ncbi:TPA: radical SAM protein [Candidatus Geothermarchaeota archaeon]|nr:radical SAM protein [Candidatus Geothermarchaeota archaeon]HIQ13869.1 radical SAM protein [Thermoprotei archaeon]